MRKKKTAEFIKRKDGMGEGRMFSGPETYIFGCDKWGEVSEWGELEGSFRGGLDHEKALWGAGYEVID